MDSPRTVGNHGAVAETSILKEPKTHTRTLFVFPGAVLHPDLAAIVLEISILQVMKAYSASRFKNPSAIATLKHT